MCAQTHLDQKNYDQAASVAAKSNSLARGNVYVAVWGSRSVVRVAPDGRVTTVVRTAAPWAPSGVTVAPNGDLWLLEYSTTNEARVRRVRRDGRSTIY